MERIAYEGKAFVIEWYIDPAGKSQPFEFFENLDFKQQAQVLSLFKTLGDNGKIFNKEKFRNEGDKIFAFKPKPDRFLSFFTYNKKVIVTNAFTKKQDKLPVNEMNKALKAKNDYEKRMEEGNYYD